MAYYSGNSGRQGGTALAAANYGGGVLANSLGLGDMLKIDSGNRYNQYKIAPIDPNAAYATGKLRNRIGDVSQISKDKDTYSTGQALSGATWAVASAISSYGSKAPTFNIPYTELANSFSENLPSSFCSFGIGAGVFHPQSVSCSSHFLSRVGPANGILAGRDVAIPFARPLTILPKSGPSSPSIL